MTSMLKTPITRPITETGEVRPDETGLGVSLPAVTSGAAFGEEDRAAFD